MPGWPPRAVTHRPESSAMAITPERSAAKRAFSMALPTKVDSVSSGSGRPSSPAETRAKRPSSRAAISGSLPGLWVATRSFSTPCSERGISGLAYGLQLQRRQFGDAGFGQTEEGLEFLAREAALLARGLDFDDVSRAGENEIGVGLGV